MAPRPNQPYNTLKDYKVLRARERVRTRKSSCNAEAARYGVSRVSMWMALTGKTYRHLPGALRRGLPKR